MGRVFCSSDWHGCGKVADKVIDFLASDDILYFLGDACDRGNDGVRLLQWLLNDPRVRMIKGNHDEMLEKSMPKIISTIDMSSYIDSEVDNWIFNNGGFATWERLKDLPLIEIEDIISKIRSLPLELKYKSSKGHTIIMEHAGYTPFDIPHRTHEPLWDRNHFNDCWQTGIDANKTYLIHGHTPVQYLKYLYGYIDMPSLTKEEMKEKKLWLGEARTNNKPTILHYCNNHKIDIDMCTITSKRIALLDLNTFEEFYFDEEES